MNRNHFFDLLVYIAVRALDRRFLMHPS